ncbi:MAG: MerR family transcriptional regulator [Pseudomonadota bacterium]|nr:MerR family transcriptional regulator [Pseudomonadota bacterium]
MPNDDKQALFTIGVFSRLTGINPGTLRIWERRYKIASPIRRGARDVRMYSQSDVDRLALVKALVDGGHPVSTVAQLSTDELRLRLNMSAEKVSKHASGTTKPSRVVVLGEFLAIRLAEYTGQFTGIEICGVFSSAAELDDKAKALAPEVLVVEYLTLQPETLAHVWRHLAVTGVRHAVVIFGFGARQTVKELERAGVLCMQAPVSLPEIERACASARGAPVHSLGEVTARAEVVPPRRFSAEQLARIASSATPVKCECPHHLVDLVNGLVSFETYSAECANLYPHDADIHELLHTTTAAARALLETALAKVVEAEGITVD